MEACASNVETFAAGGVIFQVSCWGSALYAGDSMLTDDLDRLHCHCIATSGLDWRHHIASIAPALFVYPSNTVYSNTPKRFLLESANQDRSTHGSVEMSHRLSLVQPLGIGVLEWSQSYTQVSHLKRYLIISYLWDASLYACSACATACCTPKSEEEWCL